jgi:hypothetical protein
MPLLRRSVTRRNSLEKEETAAASGAYLLGTSFVLELSLSESAESLSTDMMDETTESSVSDGSWVRLI